MQARTRWWLLAVILLVVASLLGVLEPVKLHRRKNPDTGKYVDPVRKVGPFLIYKPHFGVTLGLDLRGGVHLVLAAQDEGIFRYKAPGLNLTMDEDQATEEREKIVRAIPKEKLGAKGTKKVDVALDTIKGELTVRTRVKDQADLVSQGKSILELLGPVLPGITEVSAPEYNMVKEDHLRQIQKILSTRVDEFGVAEPIIQVLPKEKRVLVEMPGTKDPKEAQRLIRQTAELQFKSIPKKYAFKEHGPIMDDKGVYTFTDSSNPEAEPVSAASVLAVSTTVLTGKDLKPNSRVIAQTGQQTAVSFEFKGAARETLTKYTQANVSHYMAIVLDNKLYMAPIIKSVLKGSGVIEGGFDTPEGMRQANDLKILLNAGALPFDLEFIENRTVSPELGGAQLRTALFAGLIGLAVVLLFMVAYYRLPGLMADLALLIYIALLMGAIKAVDQVLTLPGILAVIISIGMAVDANIIIFERLKEEIRTGKTLRSAMDAAFKRAWTAILDANVCSIGTGIVLFIFGTGPIKGFAVALVLGVAVSLFTAVTVTRLFMNMVVDSKLGQNVALYGVSPKEITG